MCHPSPGRLEGVAFCAWIRTSSSSSSRNVSTRCPRPLAPNSSTSLCCPDLERTERIGEFWSYPQSRAFAELLIDCEEDRTLRVVLVGMLREMGR